MKGYLGVFLFVACVLPAFGRTKPKEEAGNCGVLSLGRETAWTDNYHQNLDGTQYVKVDIPKMPWRRLSVVGTKLVACDEEGKPELVLTKDKLSILVMRSKPGNKNGYLQLINYLEYL